MVEGGLPPLCALSCAGHQPVSNAHSSLSSRWSYPKQMAGSVVGQLQLDVAWPCFHMCGTALLAPAAGRAAQGHPALCAVCAAAVPAGGRGDHPAAPAAAEEQLWQQQRCPAGGSSAEGPSIPAPARQCSRSRRQGEGAPAPPEGAAKAEVLCLVGGQWAVLLVQKYAGAAAAAGQGTLPPLLVTRWCCCCNKPKD